MKFLSNVLLKSICILLIYVVSINSFKSSSIVQSSYLHNLWIPLILVWFNRGVTCPLAFSWFLLKSHRTGREVCSDTICNIPNFLLFDNSHTTTLHATLLVKTLHWSELSVGSPFRDLENQLCLLLGSMNDPTNQHKTFQRVRLSLRGFLGNFLEGHPSHNYSKPSTLNCGVLKWWVTKN